MKYKIGDEVRCCCSFCKTVNKAIYGYITHIKNNHYIVKWNSGEEERTSEEDIKLIKPKPNHPHTNLFK